MSTFEKLSTHVPGLDAITATLEREGVASFCDAYRTLLECIETKLHASRRASVAR